MGRSGGKNKHSSHTQTTRSSVLEADLVVVPGTPFNQEEMEAYSRQVLLAAGTKPGDIVAYDLWDYSETPYVLEMERQAAELGIGFEVIVPEDDPKFRDQVEKMINDEAIFIGPEFPEYAYQYNPNRDEYSPASSNYNPDAPLPSGSRFSIERYEKEYDRGNIRWMNGIIPNQAWADRVYPEIEDPSQRLRALGEDFQKFLRIHKDSQETWSDHVKRLRKRAAGISEMEPSQFSFSSRPDSLYPGDPGTDLVLSPIEGARFIPVELETASGKKTWVNAPSEEVFFTPAPGSANGRASMSRPYQTTDDQGVDIEISGVVLEYEDGAVVSARSVLEPEKNDVLRRDFIDRGPETGQSILSEIGLVDPQSPIARTNKNYGVSIIDENPGTHGGHGYAWSFSIEKDALDRGVLPDNMKPENATVHRDLTFGSPELDVSLTDKDGQSRDLVKDGFWVGP